MWDEYKRNVLVDVFLTKDEKEIKRLFTEINSGEPVRLIDMPSEVDFRSLLSPFIIEICLINFCYADR